VSSPLHGHRPVAAQGANELLRPTGCSAATSLGGQQHASTLQAVDGRSGWKAAGGVGRSDVLRNCRRQACPGALARKQAASTKCLALIRSLRAEVVRRARLPTAVIPAKAGSHVSIRTRSDSDYHCAAARHSLTPAMCKLRLTRVPASGGMTGGETVPQ
jgi:hypothetical protein